MSEWISVKEELPEQFHVVIACRTNKAGERVVEAGYYSGDGIWKTVAQPTKGVTHWMPMPKPPKEDV